MRGDAKADDATNEDVHDQHDPMVAQEDRFNTEQIGTPEAVFRLDDECQPGRTIAAGVIWPVVLREHAAHYIFIDVEAEGVSDLLGNTLIAELGITPLQINNGFNELYGRAFRPGFA